MKNTETHGFPKASAKGSVTLAVLGFLLCIAGALAVVSAYIADFAWESTDILFWSMMFQNFKVGAGLVTAFSNLNEFIVPAFLLIAQLVITAGLLLSVIAQLGAVAVRKHVAFVSVLLVMCVTLFLAAFSVIICFDGILDFIKTMLFRESNYYQSA